MTDVHHRSNPLSATLLSSLRTSLHSSTMRFACFTALTLSTISAIAIPTSSHAQRTTFSPLERHVIELADERAPADSLVRYLGHADPNIAWRAAVGLANLGDTSARQPLVTALLGKEDRHDVLEAIVYALGVLGPSDASYMALVEVTKHLGGVQHSNTWKAIGRAVPKEKAAHAAKLLGLYASGNGDAADALPSLAIRKLATPEILDVVDRYADHASADARWRAAYLFARAEDSANLAKHFDRLKELLIDVGSADARMFAALAMGRLHNPDALTSLSRAFRGEKDWRVKTNIMNAFARWPRLDSSMFELIRQTVEFASKTNLPDQHVAIAGLMTLEQMIDAGKISSKDSADLDGWLESFAPTYERYSDLPVNVRSATLPVLARISKRNLRFNIGDINSYQDRIARYNVPRAGGYIADTMIFEELLTSMAAVAPREQSYRLEALDRIWQTAKSRPKLMADLEEKKLANIYRHMLIRLSDLVDDPAVVTSALQSIQDSTIIIDTAFRHEAEGYVTGYLSKFRSSHYHDQFIGALQAARWLGLNNIEAIKQLNVSYDYAAKAGDRAMLDTVKSVFAAIKSTPTTMTPLQRVRPTLDWGLLETAPDTMLIMTDRGVIKIRLLKHDAPLSVMNFLKLADMSFYANGTFHRVVPNFVIQDGDPTGTGSGGPDWSIRTEISPAEYETPGMVGMASSGKDTEGSQWFITHLPTPHLDTRYTVFGEVVDGMGVVNQIQQFDKIENIIPFRR